MTKRAWGMLLLILLVGGAILLWWLPRNAGTAWGPDPQLPRGRATEGCPVLGYREAPLDLILYEDFASPQSKRLHDETEPQVIAQYVAHGQVRLVSIPIAAVGGDSYRAMAAALCLADLDKYWAYRDVLYAYQGKAPFTREQLASLATKVGVSKERFYACYDLKQHSDEITQWNDQAKARGVQGAPTYEIRGIGLVPGFRPFDDPDMPGVRQILDIALLEVMTK